ncbi:MAG: tetratricopeptide repeat-containing protein [Bacteroidota bacterium]|jgi:tetratricopeptide (TPR) repeat protein
MKTQKICFVIMGFGKKQDPITNRTIDLDETYNKIIRPTVSKCNYTCVRADEISDSSLIDRSMYGLLYRADIVIADISTYNPNALYELGTRHALRPYSTIIIKENNIKIPFDLDHNRVLSYEHLGNEISVSEIRESSIKLEGIIRSIDKNPQTDSPLYVYIPSCKAPEISEEELNEIIGDLHNKENTIFTLTEEAKELMRGNKFDKAAEKWHKLSEMVENDSFYLQQEALCTYKSEKPSKIKALTDALQIMSQLKKSTDTETLGILGAINKRLWNEIGDSNFLDSAINFYKKGWTLYEDYYTGENYAICLVQKALLETEEKFRIHKLVEAEEVRRKIIDIVLPTLEDTPPEELKWKYATLSISFFSINNEQKQAEFEKKFIEQNPVDWEIKTFNETKQKILDLKRKLN